MKQAATYIMTNKPKGTLYVGMTGHFPARIQQHREGSGSAFCKRYGLGKLVWYELFELVTDAIRQEKQIKAGSRKDKIALIESVNPRWNDLYLTLNA
ncbi:MAG: GIY-YIG nuclease family protein [Pseudomonadaceae bacterium]|nr:GIY-YIG nuclease family protein [Pseudomonadaceae bacterium]